MRQQRTSLSAIILLAMLTGVALAAGVGPTCRQWKWVNPQPATRNLGGVAAGAPGVVAVGDYGTILFSPAGISWTEVASGTIASLWDVVWTGAEFLAVGDSGTAVRSDDGVTWTVVPTDTDADFRCLTHGDGVFVAGARASESADSMTLLSSPDGGHWTGHPPGGGYVSFTGVAWGNGLFVAVANDYSAASADGESWTGWHEPRFSHAERVSVVWADSQFVAISLATGTVFTTSDGLTWNYVQDSTTGVWAEDLAWTGDAYVVVGGSQGWVSSDLVSWIRLDDQFTDYRFNQRAIAWTGDRVVVVGDGGLIATSANATDWEVAQGNPGGSSFAAIDSGGGRVVGIGVAGGATSSTDGLNWHTALDSPGFRGLVYGDDMFLAVGIVGSVGTTVDGIEWHTTASGFGHLRDVTWSSSHYVAVQTSGWKIISSADGTDWVLEDDLGFGRPHGVHSNSAAVVAVGSFFDYYSCPMIVVGNPGGPWIQNLDFIGWEYDGTWFEDVTFGAGRWVAVGSDGLIVTSTDLEDWQVVDIGFEKLLESVAWTGDEFIIASEQGLVLSSFDGLAWTRESTPTGVSLSTSTGFGDDVYVASFSGAILRGSCDWPQDLPTAAFSLEQEPLVAGVPVRFSSEASGFVQAVGWDFGDGGTSTASTATHTFASPGDHVVSLTVCNDNGCDTAARDVDVVVLAPHAGLSWIGPQPVAGSSTLWEDLSTGAPDSWLWSFGDGGVSPARSPRHTYDLPGIFQVRLRVENRAGADTAEAQVVVGSGAVVTTSTDSSFVDIVSDGTSLLAATGRSLWISDDGLSWSQRGLPDGFVPRSLTHRSGQLLAVGHTNVPSSSDAVAVTTDGGDWQVYPVPDEPLMDIAASADAVVVVGTDGLVMVSPNLVDWSYGASGTTLDIHSVATDGSRFVLAADELLESTDGLEWTPALDGPEYPSSTTFDQDALWASDGRGVFRRNADGAWVRYDDPVNAEPGPGVLDLAVVGDLVLTTGSTSVVGYLLRWYSPQRRLWIEDVPLGGSRVAEDDQAVYVIDGLEIRRLAVHSGGPIPIFADGFETGDLAAWSGFSARGPSG